MKFHRPSKRIIIVLISVSIILVAGVYTWLSLNAWKAYQARLASEQATYQTLKQSALEGKTTSDRLKALRALDDKLKSRAYLCDISPVFAWQAVVLPPLKNGVEQCQEAVRKLNAVAGPLHSLRSYLDTSEKIQSELKQLAPKASFTEDNWAETGLEQAKSVQAKLKNISAPADAAALKTKAVSLTGTVVSTWQTLIDADQAKDKTAFMNASAGVMKAYAGLTELADIADESIQAKVSAVTKAAKDL